jgi:DNA polymerase-1
MRPALEAKGRLEPYALQRNAIPAVADMQLRGLGFDIAEHARQAHVWAVELADARRAYLDMTGNPAPSKPDEVRSWLATVAGERLTNWPRTSTGELSIERRHLKRLALSDEPTVRPVLSILAHEKLLSTFGPKLRQFVNPITGRIHCSYNIAASKAGRFTVSKPNLQQLPSTKAPDFKAAVVASPGCVLVGGDWSQIEMRAAAWISGDPALTAVYEEQRDLHTETAALIAGVPVNEVTAAQRQGAKAVNFGSIYGVGPRALAASAFDTYGVDMTLAEAKGALDRFFAAYRTLKRWMYNHADLCQRQGFVRIGAGRIVEAAWEPAGHLSFPQCCNLPVQGAAADAMLRAIPLVFRRLRGINGGMVACVHDELLLEVAEADAETARGILEASMIEAFEATFPGAPLNKVVEVKVGKTWKEVK